MTHFCRKCPYCDSERTEITDETHDVYDETYHIMLNLICLDCGEEFVGEDSYTLTASATAKDPDELWNKLYE